MRNLLISSRLTVKYHTTMFFPESAVKDLEWQELPIPSCLYKSVMIEAKNGALVGHGHGGRTRIPSPPCTFHLDAPRITWLGRVYILSLPRTPKAPATPYLSRSQVPRWIRRTSTSASLAPSSWPLGPRRGWEDKVLLCRMLGFLSASCWHHTGRLGNEGWVRSGCHPCWSVNL